MSNPALNRLLRGGGLTEFHTGGSTASSQIARSREGVSAGFSGEGQTVSRFFASAAAEKKGEGVDFTKKENREESGGKRKKKDKEEGEESSDDDGPHYDHDGIHASGADADGDGKTNEAAKKKKPDFSDRNKNGKPDAFEKK